MFLKTQASYIVGNFADFLGKNFSWWGWGYPLR